MRSLLIAILCLALHVPSLLVGESPETGPTAGRVGASLPTAKSPSAAPQGQQPTSVRPNSMASPPHRSYEREARPRRHRHISKGEVAFMAGIAGTSMGIGAIAAGGTGLAIGAIAGGWEHTLGTGFGIGCASRCQPPFWGCEFSPDVQGTRHIVRITPACTLHTCGSAHSSP